MMQKKMNKLDNKGYSMIIQFEGLRLKPYLCSAGVATIGVGSTCYLDGTKVTINDKPITKEFALELFKSVADKFARNVNNLITCQVNQQQFNSLCSFAYNCGISAFSKSTLLKKVNMNPADPTITNEFLKWNKSGGIVIQGLSFRRNEEAKNYMS